MSQTNRIKAVQDCGDAPLSGDINVLALVKDSERYVFLYDQSGRAEVLRTFGRFAANPELSLTWYDAAQLSQKVRLLSESQKEDATE